MKNYVGGIIRNARNQKKLTTAFVASVCGLTEASYEDVETYGSEFFDNISLGEARRICDVMQLNLLDLVAKYLAVQIRETKPLTRSQYFSRHNLITEARVKHGMSECSLGNAVGFEETSIVSMERSSDFMEVLPITLLVDIANALGLDLGLLIGSLSKDAQAS